MKIRELQTSIADALNGDERLVQNGCTAVAEDALTVQNSIAQSVSGAGRIALVVLSPRAERDADGCLEGVPVTLHVVVRCIEAPALRNRRGGFTALDAAEAVVHALDGETLAFVSLGQTADVRTGTVTVSAEFTASVIITP